MQVTLQLPYDEAEMLVNALNAASWTALGMAENAPKGSIQDHECRMLARRYKELASTVLHAQFAAERAQKTA